MARTTIPDEKRKPGYDRASRPGLGVRLNPRHSEQARAKIRTSMVINRLQKCLTGELTMTAQQVRIAFGLLAKTMPDLTRTEHTGFMGGPVLVEQTQPGTPVAAESEYLDMLQAPKVVHEAPPPSEAPTQH